MITNEGDEDDEDSGGHKRLVSPFFLGEKEELEKSFWSSVPPIWQSARVSHLRAFAMEEKDRT